MTPTFQIDELRLKNDSSEEQLRIRKIFELLRDKAKNGELLSEHEKNFFCMSVRLSHVNDGKLEDYPWCDNFKFVFIYYTYFTDLTGGSTYYKPKGTSIYKVEPKEAQEDLKYLESKSDEWDVIVQKENHSEQLLQQIAIEARNEIKVLDSQPEFKNDIFSKGSFRYVYKRMAILLHSKFLYCMALEIFEALKKDDFILKINAIDIEFNEFSLIHILNRHYAAIIKQYESAKSFHIEDFEPRILSTQLKEILSNIDKSKVLANKSVDKIGFRLNGIDYLIWTSAKTKSVKGKGNIPYRRLDTFYPINDEEEIKKINTNTVLIKISDSLSVYVPK